jgi:3-methyl-2-oxobutanoate hydroxymethyltransferase
MDAVAKLIQAGAHAIKLEGAKGNLNIIEHIVDSGVPVMGHIGLTPQHVHSLGGFKLQGKTLDAQQALELQAQQLQSRGCFAIVLECIPCSLAKKISNNLDIPTIGIGAGVETDGQVLVFQDLLGLLNTGFKPKFVKSYLNGAELITQSLDQYANEVRQNIFPSEKYSFKGAA